MQWSWLIRDESIFLNSNRGFECPETWTCHLNLVIFITGIIFDYNQTLSAALGKRWRNLWQRCAWTTYMTSYPYLPTNWLFNHLLPVIHGQPCFFGVTAAGAQAMPLSSKRLRRSILRTCQTGAIRDWRKTMGWHPKKTFGVQSNSLFWRVPQTIFEGVLSSIFDFLGHSFNTDFYRLAAVPIAHRGSLAAWHQHTTGLAAMRAWREHEVLLRLFRARLPKARPNLRDCQMTGFAMYQQQPSQEYFWSMRPSYS